MTTANGTPAIAPEILTFYGETVDESGRLTSTADGILEMVRTQELLRRHLPEPPARVLDVGGGPGAHARWLVKDGFDVHLVDPVPRHVDAARATGATVELGDARALTAGTGAYDVVLLLGPLYHLLQRQERLQAIAEARRVTRPGGLIAAAAIGRYASLFEHTATTWLGTNERVREAVADILATGVHEPGRKGFTSAYFHTPGQLTEEMTAAGLDEVQVYGIEGPGWGALKATEQHTGQPLTPDTPLFASALEAARLAEPHPELLATASHMLAITRTSTT
ncbi:class I SAM-dependent methyltransferase [Streptomyces sp. NPDC051018]|uniref:class I SAM-dependent methyltransferase n=1 Tax=Streptomyces sp. NPDC051018 TaxID=3365639 RepID=UPI0037A8F66B